MREGKEEKDMKHKFKKEQFDEPEQMMKYFI